MAALLLLALLWGNNRVVMKVGVRYSDPFTFAALRNFLGALALFVLLAARRGSLRPSRPFPLTLVYGLVQTSLSGLAAGLLAVGGGLCWAVASVVFKTMPKGQRIDLLSFGAWQALFGSLPLIVMAALTAKAAPTWNGSFAAALLYNVFLASAVAWLLRLYVLRSLSAGVADISSLAIPVVGILAAWVQLGGVRDPSKWWGWCASWRRSPGLPRGVSGQAAARSAQP